MGQRAIGMQMRMKRRRERRGGRKSRDKLDERVLNVSLWSPETPKLTSPTSSSKAVVGIRIGTVIRRNLASVSKKWVSRGTPFLRPSPISGVARPSLEGGVVSRAAWA